jgi:hypothetical protein
MLTLTPVLGTILLQGETESRAGERNSTRWIIEVFQAASGQVPEGAPSVTAAFHILHGLQLQRPALHAFHFSPLDRGLYFAQPSLTCDDGLFRLTALPVPLETTYLLSIDTMHSMHR